jgi:hypothetical protein
LRSSRIFLTPSFCEGALAGDRLQASHVLAQLPDLFDTLVLPQLDLKAQPEELLGRFALLLCQLHVAQIANLVGFHRFSLCS